MTERVNAFGQPIGPSLASWSAPPAPARATINGRTCRLEPLDPARHANQLFAAFSDEPNSSAWTYLPYGPFANREAFDAWLSNFCTGDDPLFFAIIVASSNEALGMTSYLRITPALGTIETGHLHYGPRLQSTTAATETTYLLLRRAFELGYRRVEWKCDALNAPSRTAASRLGFTFEGIFRQATVYKQRSRDNAWYAMIDSDWPRIRIAYERWLDPSNFDERGSQRTKLTARAPSE